jgi:hypothetical protein
VARGDIVMFAETDTTQFGAHFVYGTLGPLLTRPGLRGIWPLRAPEAYLHAVATDEGLRLDSHAEELIERPPMAEVLAAEQDRGTVA